MLLYSIWYLWYFWYFDIWYICDILWYLVIFVIPLWGAAQVWWLAGTGAGLKHPRGGAKQKTHHPRFLRKYPMFWRKNPMFWRKNPMFWRKIQCFEENIQCFEEKIQCFEEQIQCFEEKSNVLKKNPMFCTRTKNVFKKKKQCLQSIQYDMVCTKCFSLQKPLQSHYKKPLQSHFKTSYVFLKRYESTLFRV